MKASDLREKSADDLRELQKSLTSDVFQNRLKNFTNRLDDTSSIRRTRRDLARVLTLLSERSSGKAPAAAPAPAVEVKAAAPEAKPAKAAPAKKATKKPSTKKDEAK